MTNVALVARKLAILEEHLRRLRERRPAELATFASDTLLQDAAFAVLQRHGLLYAALTESLAGAALL
jgi:hypothetical protein